jgi:glycosyltransferase involved in cell wall biosynthesis
LIKIIALIDNKIDAGGGFNQAINSIINLRDISKKGFILEVITTRKINLIYLKQLEINASYIPVNFIDYLFVFFSNFFLFSLLQQKIKALSPLEIKLIKRECDLVYFTTPSILASNLQKLNYIFTLWDLCHTEHPEFPEVRFFGKYILRDKYLRKAICSSFIVITESDELSNIASLHFGVDKERFISLPLSESPFLKNLASANIFNVKKVYKLAKDYFFYPAQFWPHKNHIRILQALLLLRDSQDLKLNVVFSGKDYGNLNYLSDFIKNNKLNSQVQFLGFVPADHMRGLYENSKAVVMPTYFGPSNIPPIEAWSLGIPLIYPANLSKKFKKAVIAIDQNCEKDLANALIAVTKPQIRKKLIVEGYKFLEQQNKNRLLAFKKLAYKIKEFSKIRETWR